MAVLAVNLVGLAHPRITKFWGWHLWNWNNSEIEFFKIYRFWQTDSLHREGWLWRVQIWLYFWARSTPSLSFWLFWPKNLKNIRKASGSCCQSNTSLTRLTKFIMLVGTVNPNPKFIWFSEKVSTYTNFYLCFRYFKTLVQRYWRQLLMATTPVYSHTDKRALAKHTQWWVCTVWSCISIFWVGISKEDN